MSLGQEINIGLSIVQLPVLEVVISDGEVADIKEQEISENTSTDESAPVESEEVATDETAPVEEREEVATDEAVPVEGVVTTDEAAPAEGEVTTDEADEAAPVESEVTTDETVPVEGDIMGDEMIDGGEAGMMVDPNGGMANSPKDPLLASKPFVIGVTAGVLVISIVLGVLLAKRRIKKGIELYEN